MTTKYTKWPKNIPNGHEIYQHLSLQDTHKFTRLWRKNTADFALLYRPQIFTYLRIVTRVMAYFQTKIPHLGKFWMDLQWNIFWYMLWPFGIFYGQLIEFVSNWYILWLFGIFYPVLVCYTKKSLATLSVKHFQCLRKESDSTCCAVFKKVSFDSCIGNELWMLSRRTCLFFKHFTLKMFRVSGKAQGTQDEKVSRRKKLNVIDFDHQESIS
jgi:hypothetical protein